MVQFINDAKKLADRMFECKRELRQEASRNRVTVNATVCLLQDYKDKLTSVIKNG